MQDFFNMVRLKPTNKVYLVLEKRENVNMNANHFQCNKKVVVQNFVW